MPMVSVGFTMGWFGEAWPGVRLSLHGRGGRRELIMIVKHGVGQSVQGLSGVGNVCVRRDIPELRGLLCGYVTRMESSATKNTPS